MALGYHKSVLLKESIDFINILPGGTYADLTFGEGGHTEAMLGAGASRVWGIDRDPTAIDTYLREGSLRKDPRLKLKHQRFSEFISQAQPNLFDGVLIDLGVSTRQLISPERGFTFQNAGPLDMRMDQKDGRTLEEVLEGLTQDQLADILYKNADLKNSRLLARKILSAYKDGHLKTTEDLAACFGPKMSKTHPATVPFMALRMAVNQELEEIEKAFSLLLNCLRPQGRLVVITFHSTEDRLVKTIMKRWAGKCVCQELICQCKKEGRVKLLTQNPLVPSEEEQRLNPRSRSAKLRCIEKIF